MPVTIDTIPFPHSIVYGTPAPDNNYCGKDAGWKAYGADTFDLANFPANITPSGGASCVISKSEMVQLWIQMHDYEPRNDSGVYSLYKMTPDGEKLRSSKVTTPDSAEDPSWTWYFSWDYAFFGRFDWEINEPGKYSIEAVYPQGMVRWEFTVIDSAPLPPVTPPQLPGIPPIAGCIPEGRHYGEARPDGGIYTGECCTDTHPEWDPGWALNVCVRNPAPPEVPPDLGQPPPEPPLNIGCPDGTAGIWPVCIPLPGQPPAAPPEVPPDLGQPPAEASPCPRGETYPAEWKDAILGCDQGYQRPLFGDFCECTHGKNADIIDKLGSTNTLILAAVGVLVFLGLVRR